MNCGRYTSAAKNTAELSSVTRQAITNGRLA